MMSCERVLTGCDVFNDRLTRQALQLHVVLAAMTRGDAERRRWRDEALAYRGVG